MTATPTASALHSELRAATKTPHHLLDHHPVLAALVRADLRIDQYGHALAALHGVHQAAEAWIFRFLQRHPCPFDFATRSKLPALEADLAALGRAPIPLVDTLNVPFAMGSFIGILYTLEGSTLGGQFIARQLSQWHGASLPMQFFNGYGALTRQRWNEFLEFAETACPVDEYDLASAAAVAMFDTIRRHLDQASAQVG
jgi:heme oxygenase (biliverdin-IX-beta and delta-forming)